MILSDEGQSQISVLFESCKSSDLRLALVIWRSSLVQASLPLEIFSLHLAWSTAWKDGPCSAVHQLRGARLGLFCDFRSFPLS